MWFYTLFACSEPVPAKVETFAEPASPVAQPVPSRPTTPLAQQAADTFAWLKRHPQPEPDALPLSPDRTMRTLEQLANSTDLKATIGSLQRLNLPAVNKPESWGQPDKFRMTRYLVYESPGSRVETQTMNTALYATPPSGLDGITRQAVYAGGLKGHAEPLVWLSRQDANRAMMQGTVRVQYEDGTDQVFNVHHNNGIPYDRSITDSNLQARFWSFREVSGVLGYGDDDKIPLQPLVAVAGDVKAFGVGRVLLLVDGTEEHVVILADTGGAFENNRHQLDWYTGSFTSHEAFLAATETLPHHVQLFGLVVPETSP